MFRKLKKMLFYFGLAVLVAFLLTFPFIHVGGSYYRGLLVIWNKYPLQSRGGGGFIDLTPDINWFEIVWWAEPLSFQHFDGEYAVDRNYVYLGQRLDNVDPHTFEYVGNGFYRDKDNVRRYSVIKKIANPSLPPQGFDSATFSYIGANFVKDKTGVYYLGHDLRFASEKNYYHRSAIGVDVFSRAEGIDPNSFASLGNCIFKDKNHTYRANICFDLGGVDRLVFYKDGGGSTTPLLEVIDNDGSKPNPEH